MRNLNRAYAAGGRGAPPKGQQGEPALPGEKWRSPHLPGTVRQAQNKKTSESRGNLS